MKRYCNRCHAELWDEMSGQRCAKCLLELGLDESGGDTVLVNGLAILKSSPVANESDAGASPGDPFPGRLRPERLGDYELLEEIARGGMGIVLKARQCTLNRTVALKLILSGQFASKQEVLRFQAEAEAAANLRHPNIVAVYETGEHQGQHYFSMEYVQGRDLAAIAQEGPLPAERAARYVQSIAQAVHYAHEQGILHRDLKPSNVLIDGDDRPRITDFGLAKRLEGDSSLTLTGQTLGSPSFMAPEQTSSRHGRISAKCDVYGIGAVLYHLLVGRPPFQAATVEEVLRDLQVNEPVAPRLLNPSVPRDLETISLKCLEKEPGKRYSTAQEVADDLGRFLGHEPIHARPISRAGRLCRWCRRKPLIAGLAAAFVLALSFGVIGVLWESSARQAALVETRLQLYAADMKGAQQAWEAGNNALMKSLLEQHRPKPGEQDLRGFEWRLLWRLWHKDDRTLFYPELGGADQVSFAPDSRSFVSVSRPEGRARVWKIQAADQPKPLQEFTNITSAAFSPSRPVLALARRGGRIGLLDTAAEREVRSFSGQTNDVDVLVFTPDGETLVSAAGQQIRVWSVASGNLSARFEHESAIRDLAISPDGRLLAAIGRNRLVQIWDLASQELKTDAVAPGRDNNPTLAFSKDGTVLTIGSDDDGTKLWNVADSRFEQNTLAGGSVAFSPDGKLFAAGSWSGLALLDWLSKEPLRNSAANRNAIVQVVFSADGQWLALAAASGVWLQNLQRSEPFKSLPRTHFRNGSLAFSPDDQTLAICSGPVLQWDLRAQQERPLPPGLGGIVAYSPDGQLAAAGGGGAGIVVWKVPSGERIWYWPGAGKSDVRCLAFSPDGELLAASQGGTGEPQPSVALVWNVRTGEPAVSSLSLAGNSRVFCFSPNSRYLAAGNSDGVVKVWNTRTWQGVSSHTEHQKYSGRGHRLIHGCVFLKDSRTLVTGDNSGRVVVWDIERAETVSTWQAHPSGIRAMALAPDGRTLATGGYENVVTLWHTATWRSMLTLERPAETMALAFSHDGQILAIGGGAGEGGLDVTRLYRAASFEATDQKQQSRPER